MIPYAKSVKPLSGVAKVFILLIPLLVIAAFAAFFADIFIMLILCILFALVLNPIVDFIEGKGIGRSLSILIVYAGIGLIGYVIFQLFVPDMIEQGASLQK